jgi:hypothetical protein
MEELSVGSGPHFIDHSRLQVKEHSSRNMFPGSSLAEERVERVITTSDGLVRGHLTIRLDTVLQTVQFPASITDLNSGLTEMNRNTLTLKYGYYLLDTRMKFKMKKMKSEKFSIK